jgi:hypothetical protein
MSSILARAFDIPPGNAAMYYPEANALVPRVADAESHTPVFKSVVVTIRPSSAPVELTFASKPRVMRGAMKRETRAC